MGTPTTFISLFLILVILCTSTVANGDHPDHAKPSKGIRAAYWPSFNSFPASSIQTSLFTHIYYAFLLPDPATFKLSITSDDQTKLPEFIGSLLNLTPPVKTLFSIGGGGSNATVFSEMASTKQSRQVFINSSIEVARKYGFQGVDLDWEFPANVVDMSNLALLYKQWRNSLDEEAKACGKPRLLLTSAVYYASEFQVYGGPRSYPAGAISKYLDWASPMCFDYHGSWENFTGEHSALYDSKSNISTNYGIRSWIQAGVPAKKLVMGLPLYGKSWRLRDPKVNGVGAAAVGVGPGDDGILLYYQIVELNAQSNATVVFDKQTKSYYSYSGTTWIGYDDVRSVALKVRFAKSLGLGGYFFWALGQDKDWTLSQKASNAWKYGG
ncbi:putative chitinase [Rosa chinensis]|uniref:Putative chitinase n=1 Tax=Rosa chinensis TaxID=74649 RepID=A0A2P6PYB4_ROSCH|nr:class V chitinase CHIT5a [Rosa chinensis]PRQ26909.1 putative chitinase [Rosa chinensis]